MLYVLRIYLKKNWTLYSNAMKAKRHKNQVDSRANEDLNFFHN